MFLAIIGGLGAPELMIILVIVVVLFGAGRLAGLGKDLGHGIREFKKATQDPEAEARRRAEEERQRAEEAGRYTSVSAAPPATNGTNADYRPAEAVPPPAATVSRPPDFTGH